MTSWLHTYSFPQCLLLCYLVVVICAEASSAGEWKLIMANYIISQELACIVYHVKSSLRNISLHPAPSVTSAGGV